jgi:hypothetical protein
MRSWPDVVTDTSDMNQPFVPAVPVGASTADGPVLSIFNATDWVAEPPELCAVHVASAAAVSDVNCWTPHPESIKNADCGSETLHVTVTSDVNQPFAPAVPEITREITGGDVSEDVTVTSNAAGRRLNVPPVLLEVWLSVMAADPTPCGVTVMVGVAPQDVKVIDVGDTVATAELDEFTATTRVVWPVRLQPFFPSSPKGSTRS